MALRSRTAARLGVAVVLAALAGPPAAAARREGHAARLVWRVRHASHVRGYRIYRRPLGGDWDAGRDVGRPPRAADGTIRFVVHGIDRTQDWVFRVTAYGRHRVESAPSNEVTLPASEAPACATDADCADTERCTANERCDAGHCAVDPVACPGSSPCTPATCDAAGGCTTATFPDGAACVASDPCVPAACHGGTCVADGPAPLGGTLRIRRLAFAAAGLHRERWVLAATLDGADGVDPHASGGALELYGPDGRLLYRGVVGASSFRGRGRRALWVDRAAGAARDAANGVRRLAIRVTRSGVRVRASGYTPTQVPLDGTLAIAIRFGDRCASDAAVACRVAGTSAICS